MLWIRRPRSVPESLWKQFTFQILRVGTAMKERERVKENGLKTTADLWLSCLLTWNISDFFRNADAKSQHHDSIIFSFLLYFLILFYFLVLKCEMGIVALKSFSLRINVWTSCGSAVFTDRFNSVVRWGERRGKESRREEERKVTETWAALACGSIAKMGAK